MPWHYQIAVCIIKALWISWILYWFISAFNTKCTVFRQSGRQQLPYVLVAILGVIFARHATNVWQWRFPPDLLTESVGCVICFIGLAFSVWRRIHLGRNWSGMVTLKENHELVTTGPYRLVRHPIYTGILLALFGSMFGLSPSWGGLLVFVGMTLAFFIKLRQEEKLMLQNFPEQYPAFKARVRAALIPFVV